MRKGWKMFWFAGCLLCGSVRASGAMISSAPDLEYSQDGTTWHAFDTLVGRQKVKNYYNYYGLSGHPGFGTKRNAASAAMYWDDKRKALSLIVINGEARHGFRNAVGEVRYTFSGLTSDTYVSLKDDPDDIDYKRGSKKGSAHFTYKSSTDGMILSGLEQKALMVKVALSPVKDLVTWRLVDGSPKKGGTFINLDEDKALYFRVAGTHATPQPPIVPPANGSGGGGNGGPSAEPPPVPEPGAALTAVAALGLFGGRRRR